MFVFFLLTVLGIQACYTQGFINLNFENFTRVPSGSLGLGPNAVVASNAVPGWTVYFNGFSYPDLIYNNRTLDSAMVSIQSTNNTQGLHLMSGGYFIWMYGSVFPSPTTVGLGQTGQIPAGANSLTFLSSAFSTDQTTVKFNGNILNCFITETFFAGDVNTPAYYSYAADISGLAGQTGELLFTSLSNGGIIFDNIQFASTPIPEPSALALAALGTLLLGFRRWK